MTDGLQRKLSEAMKVTDGTFPRMADSDMQRRQFLNRVQKPAASISVKWISAFVAASATAALLLFVLIDGSDIRGEQVAFDVGSDQLSGDEGAWLETTADSPLPIRFADGSELVMNDASARIGKASDGKVVVDLVSGRLTCSISPDSGLNWWIRAGTYRVHVTGTLFVVSWCPRQRHLRVDVSRGSVHVTGDGVTETGLHLLAGNGLEIDRGNIRISPLTVESEPPARIFTTSPPQDSSETALPHDSALAIETERPAPASTSATASVGKVPGEATANRNWLSLYNQKDYVGSVAAARREGVDSLISGLTADKLEKLARAARYARQTDVAIATLTGLKDRFKGTYRGNNALFLLGRVMIDMQGDPVAAGHWFEAYLDAVPDGNLEGEALGRLIEISRSTGQLTRAQQYARRYLAKFPDGSFASLAHSVVQ